MRISPHALSLVAVFALAGCASLTEKKAAALRTAGVSEVTVQTLKNRGVLAPEHLVDLAKHKSADEIPLRHLRRFGVDYLVQGDEIAWMRKGGVSEAVSDATVIASMRFARQYCGGGAGNGWFDYDYGMTPWTVGPYPFYDDSLWW
jgi:uncharacterized protein YjeT (DUF2065 family)